MKKIYALLAASLTLFVASTASAQDEGFIYGKIYMDDNRSYEGPIRWGKEEVYWVDVFNASKEENENVHYLTHEERDRLDEKRMWRNGNFSASSTLRWLGFGSTHERNYEEDYTHQFACQFGEIRSIRLVSSKRVELELQSGMKVKINGEGYNDIGTDLKIIDKELGEMELDWHRIEKIEFKSTPSRLAQKFGEPLYGTVETFQGAFTGYIQWDHDERLSTDKLDGESEDGKVALIFDKITSLEPHLNRTKVVLKSGRELELRGSNDVNSENRGIIITTDKGTIIDVPWDEFKKLTLKSGTTAPVVKYESFKSQKELHATVITHDGKTLSGRMVLDLDEEYDFELYQGKSEEIEYSVPLRNIRRIVVSGGDRAEVFLANGEKLSLNESQDVGELNQGVLVFAGKDKPVYVPWEEVKEIQLN